jgi:hypothetical protein
MKNTEKLLIVGGIGIVAFAAYKFLGPSSRPQMPPPPPPGGTGQLPTNTANNTQNWTNYAINTANSLYNLGMNIYTGVVQTPQAAPPASPAPNVGSIGRTAQPIDTALFEQAQKLLRLPKQEYIVTNMKLSDSHNERYMLG